MSSNRVRNLAVVVAVAGGMIGLGLQRSAVAETSGTPPNRNQPEVGADQIKIESGAEASKQKPLSSFGSVAQVQPIENTAGKSDVTKKGKRVDDRSEVIDNGDGTKTVRIAVSPQSSDGKAAKLKTVGGRFQAEGTLQPISVASSTGDPDLATLGSPGRQLRIGRPTVAGGVDTVQATPPGNAKNVSSERKISDRGVKPGEAKRLSQRSFPLFLKPLTLTRLALKAHSEQAPI